MKLLLPFTVLVLSPALAAAQHTVVSAALPAAHAIIAPPAAIQWQPAPASLPPGASAVVLEGDPAQPGPFTLRLSLPHGYRIPPHYHGGQERVTVLSGTFVVGTGNTFDTAAATELPAGTYASMPAGMAHYAFAKGETVIQLNNVGPWSITYVNPADDPRKRPAR